MGDVTEGHRADPTRSRPASEQVAIAVESGPGWSRVTVAGELSDMGARGVRGRVEDLRRAGVTTIVVDLERCPTLGPAALDVLVSATAALRETGASLIVSGLGPDTIQRMVREGLGGQLTVGRLPAAAGRS